jgi:hypothetical protein
MDMTSVQHRIADYHRSIHFHLVFCAWSLIMIGLIIFAIRRMGNSN